MGKTMDLGVIILISSGLIIMFISQFTNIITSEEKISYFSFGISIVSLGIAFLSIKISTESDYRINNIANANFLSILSRFEDKRLDLQFLKNIEEIKYPNVVIWKAFVDIKEMKELLEFCNIKKDSQRNMINLQCQLLRIVNEQEYRINDKQYKIKDILSCEAISHLLQISIIVLNLKYTFEGFKKELLAHIGKLFDESGIIIVDETYISNTIPFLNEVSVSKFIEQKEKIKTKVRNKER